MKYDLLHFFHTLLTLLMWCIICTGLVSKLVISRLMVGHTHEDIDARFALIWKRVRSAFVLCMSQYKNAIEQAVSRDDLPCAVKDVMVVPDYNSWIEKFIDKKFGRYAKRMGETDWTVLQFTMEKVTDEREKIFFPQGVRTHWRPFSSAYHTRLVRDEAAPCGMTFDRLAIKSYPPAYDELPGNCKVSTMTFLITKIV